MKDLISVYTVIEDLLKKCTFTNICKRVHKIVPPESINRTIIEYHVTVLNKTPTSEKAQSRMKLYSKYPVIKSKHMSSLKFYYTQILKPFHLHYDAKKGYIQFVGKTKDDLRI